MLYALEISCSRQEKRDGDVHIKRKQDVRSCANLLPCTARVLCRKEDGKQTRDKRGTGRSARQGKSHWLEDRENTL